MEITLEKCKFCHRLGWHDSDCESLPLDERHANLLAERKTANEIMARQAKVVKRLREQVTLWQGKHALLRHENNKLRKKNVVRTDLG